MTAPFVLSVTPLPDSTGVARETPVVVEFSEPMNQALVEGALDVSDLLSSELSLTWSPDSISSIDTVHRDLARMDEASNSDLELLTAEHGLSAVKKARCERLHCDIDTTVETVFGNQEGAELGYNPHYRGRPSYHPLLSVVAETQTCVGAELRAGNAGLGADEASLIQQLC